MGLVDSIGTEHARVASDARIVSLVPSITELLCDLGLAENIVGRTGFCVHPKDRVRRIPKVGGTKDVDMVKLRELQPTHVILNIDENRSEAADAMRRFVPTLVVTHPLGPQDNFELYRLLGGIFDRELECEQLCSQLEKVLDKAASTNRSAERQVLYLIWRDPWMTVSRDTYISRMLGLVNWRTIPASATDRYPEIDLFDLGEAPELVLLSSEPYPFRNKHAEEIRSVLRSQTRVELIAGDQISWYGSRAIQGIQYLMDFAGGMNGNNAMAPGA